MFIGKFAQRSNLTKTEMVHEPKRFFDLLYSSEFEVCDARLVNDDMVEVQYRNTGEFAEQNNKVNVVIAAFSTAYARLKLYDLLDLLQERVLYYDTDSVIYVHKPGKPDPPLGNYLGDLTDELNGDYITSFVSGGPKNYAYRTKKGKTDTKIRGITLDYAATGKLNHDVVRALVYLHTNSDTDAKVTIDMPFKITRDKKEKMHLVRRLLYYLNELFHPVPSKVIYCYGEYQKEFDKLPGVDFIEGFPEDLNELTPGHEQTLLILDDLMSECSKDQRVSDLFTRGSHHKGISVFYLTQNLFPPGKLSRTISLNSHYFIILKNPRDSLGIATLAKQMFPGRTQYLMDSFHDATKKPFSYLLIDCHPQTPENIRLRTNIFPGERHIVYIPK